MLGLKRSRKVPSELKAKFSRDERLVTSASIVDDGGMVAVTTLGLWLPGRDRLGWHQIHKATWSGSRLTVIPAVPVSESVSESESESQGYVVMADDEAIVVNLAKPEDLPAEVRERVTKSVAYTAHHELPGGGVRVVGRRVPGVNGVSWFVRYDEGTDTTDPEVVAFTDELVAEASQPHPE